MEDRIAKPARLEKHVVISASSGNRTEIRKWIDFWESKKCTVIDYSKVVEKNKFMELYPEVYKNFYNSIIKTDILFVANYDKNEIEGYIGAGVFAEMAFAVAQNLLNNKNIEIVLAKMPSDKIQAIDEIKLWLEIGWIRLLND